jgi:hypothetical protein
VEVLGSILGLKTHYPEVSRRFPISPGKCRDNTSIRPRPLPSTSFPCNSTVCGLRYTDIRNVYILRVMGPRQSFQNMSTAHRHEAKCRPRNRESLPPLGLRYLHFITFSSQLITLNFNTLTKSVIGLVNLH